MSEDKREELLELDTLQLIELARNKDAEATNELIARNLQRVHLYVRRKLRPRLRTKLDTTKRTLKNVQMGHSRACGRLAAILERRGAVPPYQPS